MKKLAAIGLVAVILISNIPIFNFFGQENYTYRNLKNTFSYSENKTKGLSFNGCLINYGSFLCQHPEENRTDVTLYRTFTIKPWRFWEWREMIFHSDRFSLPYLERTRQKDIYGP